MKLSTLLAYAGGTAAGSAIWVGAVSAAPGDAPAIVVAVGPMILTGLSGLSLAVIAGQRADEAQQPSPWSQEVRQLPEQRPAYRALPAREVVR